MRTDWLNLALRRSDAGAAPGSVFVNAADAAGLLDELDRRMAEGQGFAVGTLNLDHVVKLRRDPAFREAYAAQTHITADGNPIVWLSRLAGDRVELVPGSDLVLPVAGRAAARGVGVALFGSDAASLEGAAAALVRDIPALRIVHTEAPPMGFDPDSAEAGALIEAMRASGAGLVFIALGAPKQERLAARIRREAPELGALSIGAGLDFLSGTQARAPAWARRFALEWLWRLLRNPGRLWRRYRDCLALLPLLTVRALQARLTPNRHDRPKPAGRGPHSL